MSKIGFNIKKIRATKKINQTQFADIFGLSRASIGAYEEGRAEPKIETIIQIANHFSIPIDDLLTKEITVNQVYSFDIFKSGLTQQDKKHNLTPTQVETSHSTPVLENPELISYAQADDKTVFLEQNSKTTLPFGTTSATVAFKANSLEMYHLDQGINPDDLLFCSTLNIEDLNEGFIYVFVLKNSIHIRRYAVSGNTIKLIADNSNHEPLTCNKEELLACFKIHQVLTSQIPGTANISQQLKEIKQELISLKSR